MQKTRSPALLPLTVVTVRQDEQMIQVLFDAEKAFWDCVLKGEPPA